MDDATEAMAHALAKHRLERDRQRARAAGLPSLLKLSAYLPQCRRDAEIAMRFRREGPEGILRDT